MRRSVPIAAGVVSAALVATAVAALAGSDPPGTGAADLSRQGGLGDSAAVAVYATDLAGTAERHPGFGGLLLPGDGHELILHWAARTLPPDVRAAIAEAPDFLTVRVKSSRYNQAELLREARRLMGADGRITAVDVRENAAGLIVYTESEALLSATDPKRELGTRYNVVIERGAEAEGL